MWTNSLSSAQRKLVFATTLCMVFMTVEIIGGIWSHSIAILTDAAHLLSDIIGFVVSLVALSLAKRKATDVLSFGFKRAEVVGALFSVIIIWVVTGYLLMESFTRVQLIFGADEASYRPVDGRIMFSTACFGLIANLSILKILGGEHGHSHGGSGGGNAFIRRRSSGNVSGGGGHPHAHGGRDSSSHSHSHGGDKHHGHSHGSVSVKATPSHGLAEQEPLLPTSSKPHHHHHDDEAASTSSEASTLEPESIVINGLQITFGAGVKTGYGTTTSTPLLGTKSPATKKSSPPFQPTSPPEHQHDSTTDPSNINVSAAYAHAVGDLLQSIGVMIAGAIIWWFPHYRYAQLADPITTLLFSILVLMSTNEVLRTSLNLLMEGVPTGVDPLAIKQALEGIPEVEAVHDLHIWALAEDVVCLAVHLVVQSGQHRNALISAHAILKKKFHIKHSTIQTEDTKCAHVEAEESGTAHSWGATTTTT